MKKFVGIFFILSIFIVPAFAYMGHSFDEPINVCAHHILVKDQAQAMRIKSEIKNLDDFEDFAKIYSECPSSRFGGDLGCFGKKQMVKEFEEAAFKGNIGEVIGPVRTNFGYHLIWVTRKY